MRTSSAATWIRAAVHIHTSWSFDGTWDLARTARALRRRGYRAMLTAEHSQSLDEGAWRRYQNACSAVSREDFVVVPGLEYRDAEDVVHVPTWGVKDHLGDRVDVGDLLTRVAQAGGVAVWAHPGRRHAVDAFDPAWIPDLAGIEVWNRKYDGWQPSGQALDIAAAHGIPALGSLDFHRRRQFAPLATRIEVRGTVGSTSIVEALHQGRVVPQFLRQPVTRWSGGVPARGLAVADEVRRLAATTLRRIGPF